MTCEESCESPLVHHQPNAALNYSYEVAGILGPGALVRSKDCAAVVMLLTDCATDETVTSLSQTYKPCPGVRQKPSINNVL